MPPRVCRILTPEVRRGIDLGRAIDAALADLAGTAALIRCAVAEKRIGRDALGWAVLRRLGRDAVPPHRGPVDRRAGARALAPAAGRRGPPVTRAARVRADEARCRQLAAAGFGRIVAGRAECWTCGRTYNARQTRRMQRHAAGHRERTDAGEPPNRPRRGPAPV